MLICRNTEIGRAGKAWLVNHQLCNIHLIIGASLSEPHTSVTALRTRMSVYLAMDRPLAGNFKSADLQNLYVHVCTSNSNLILKIIIEFSRSSSTTVDLLSARERLRLAHRQYKSRQ